MNGMNKRQGFTLLEVLLALVVISVALVALVEAAGFSHKQIAELNQRQQAIQVADQILMQFYQRPQVNDDSGRQQYNDQVYFWSVDVKNTDNPRILRIDVKVSLEADFDHALAQLSGFKKNE